MSEEILVNVNPRETRAALLENGVLQEVFIERASRRGLTSNIYKGRVQRVLPGMQAAFIDIGLERTAFLHASDITRRADAWRPTRERTSRTSASWSPRGRTSWCRSSRIRWAPRARA
jgi:Rne/Rng family ribonuclease